MDSKREFVELARKEGANIRELCRRFSISPTTGYRLLKRVAEDPEGGYVERSRRPHRSPTKTEEEIERIILMVRDETHWGARKLSHILRRDVHAQMPPRGTVSHILKRNGRIDERSSAAARSYRRFEHASPNDLAQMDFMGWFETKAGRCHTLTMLDDHSRFALCVQACRDQTTETVIDRLTAVFRRYGLPNRITMDNGAPWGDDGAAALTKVTAWLIRLAVKVSHSRPYHPQTQGKDERFHQTLRKELVQWNYFASLDETQRAFDRWRDRYNFERPHESLNMEVPASRYQSSARSMPSKLEPIEYDRTDVVRKVDGDGNISFRGCRVRVGKGCAGLPVAIRPTTADGVFDVFFCHQRVKEITLR